jgi:hypothetical protein
MNRGLVKRGICGLEWVVDGKTLISYIFIKTGV